MKMMTKIVLTTLIAVPLAMADEPQASDQKTATKPAAYRPAAIDELVYARPYILDEAYTHAWRKEQPSVSRGYVLVLKANPRLLRPRQSAEPVLYVGDQIAERVNVGQESGHLVVLVPTGDKELDLAKTRIWFGRPALPEQCDAKRIEVEKRLAERVGISPLDAEALAAAKTRGGDELAVQDYAALRRAAAELIREYSPQETDLIRGLLAPPPEQAQVDERHASAEESQPAKQDKPDEQP